MPAFWMKCLLVGLGGFAGAAFRFGVAQLFAGWFRYPIATLLVNCLGSLLLGYLLFASWGGKGMPETFRLLLAVGFCGALTTMSTFAFETIALIKGNQLLWAGLFFVANAFGALLMVILGKYLASIVH